MSNVYFIYEGDSDYCKIGVSEDPEFRVKRLQCGNRNELVLYAYIESNEAYQLEKKLHRQFKNCYERGEWFKVSKSTIDELDYDLIYPDEPSEETIDNSEYESNETMEEVSTNYKKQSPGKTIMKSLKCKKCDKKFKSSKYLENHQNKHPDCNKVYECSKCLKTFDRKDRYTRHLNRVNPCNSVDKVNNYFTCEYCGKVYKIKSNLRNHVNSCPHKASMSKIRNLIAHNQKMFEELEKLSIQNKVEVN